VYNMLAAHFARLWLMGLVRQLRERLTLFSERKESSCITFVTFFSL
jgi:hypothetical protein